MESLWTARCKSSNEVVWNPYNCTVCCQDWSIHELVLFQPSTDAMLDLRILDPWGCGVLLTQCHSVTMQVWIPSSTAVQTWTVASVMSWDLRFLQQCCQGFQILSNVCYRQQIPKCCCFLSRALWDLFKALSLLGCFTLNVNSWFLTFQDNLSFPSAWSSKVGPNNRGIIYRETQLEYIFYFMLATFSDPTWFSSG
jgi:hypothetical protein